MTGTAPRVDAADARAVVIEAAREYFAERRRMVDSFVSRHFRFRGSARLHRHALGWDLARDPINIALAPIHVAARLGAIAARLIGADRISNWLRSREILLRTRVAVEVERLVVIELLELPWQGEMPHCGKDALADAIFSSPAVQALAPADWTETGPAAPGRNSSTSLSEYAATRSAIAEITTSLAVLGAGAGAFQKITPGMISLGPVVASALVHSSAVASFPLGSTAGSLWYSFFPTDVPIAVAIGITGTLVAVAAMIAAFAGVLADPIQASLGLHQRRLRKLIGALERDFVDGKGSAFAAREHYVARVVDFLDAAFMAFRQLRG